MSVYHTGPLIPMCFVYSFIRYRHEMTLTCVNLVGWSGCGPTSAEFEPKCQVIPVERLDTWLFQVWRGNISIPEKLSVFRVDVLDISGSNCTSHPGKYIHTDKFQNPHPTKARFKFSTFRRPFRVKFSTLQARKRTRYPWIRGLSGLRNRGGGGGGRVRGGNASNRWAQYCSHCGTLWLFQFM